MTFGIIVFHKQIDGPWLSEFTCVDCTYVYTGPHRFVHFADPPEFRTPKIEIPLSENGDLHSKTTLNRPPRILRSENTNSALKNRNSVLRKCKFRTQNCNGALGQNSALRKWKIFPKPCKVDFSTPDREIPHNSTHDN